MVNIPRYIGPKLVLRRVVLLTCSALRTSLFKKKVCAKISVKNAGVH